MKKKLLAALLLLTALPAFAQAQNSWTNTFSIEIVSRPLPTLSTNSLSITVLKDSTASGSVLLYNNGNQPGSFTTKDDVDAISMNATWINPPSGWVEFGSAPYDRAQIKTWSGLLSASIPLGFTFSYLDRSYTDVQIAANGGIQLGTGATYLLMPFYGSNVSTDTNNVRYELTEDRLVVSWEGASTTDGSLTDMHFQAHLYENGEVLYLYQKMDGATTDDATIGHKEDLTAGELAEVEDGASVLADGSTLLLTPNKWVTSSPTEGTLAKLTSSPWIFTVDATGKSAKTYTQLFTANWSDGSTTPVTVNITVGSPTPLLDVLPSTVNFSGPTGFLSTDTVTLTNTGNTVLNYSFINTTAQSAGYEWTNTTFNWDSTAGGELTTSSDSGYPALSSLGFDFPYFGAIYTNFSISVDGFVSLGGTTHSANQIIAPYMQDLHMDNQSHITFSGDRRLHVITWENIKDSKGANQTFQIIFGRNGTITFQYLELNGTNGWITSDIDGTVDYLEYLRYLRTGELPVVFEKPEGTAIGLKDTSRFVDNTLIWSPSPDSGLGTVRYEDVITYVSGFDRELEIQVPVTNTIPIYDDPLRNQAFVLKPVSTYISVSPVSGSLAVGQTQTITITGDARDLSAGTSKSAVYSILSEDETTKTLTVNLNVTTNALGELMLDTDGDGQSDRAELLAGTDELNADSAFSINMDGSRTITWTEPESATQLNRTYTIWFTPSLLDGWQKLVQFEDPSDFSYTDTEHNDATSIYYKVTID